MKFPEFNFDFMGRRKLAGSLSIGLILLSLASLTFNGLNLGLDFTGGTLVDVDFPESADLETLRGQLDDAGFVNGVVQLFGSETEVRIRMPPQAGGDPASLGDRILDTIRQQTPGAEMRQSNFVGPVVGDELTESAGLAILTALAVVMLYILFRFTKQFSVGAVVALAHDVTLVLGLFSLVQWTFDLAVVAAVLAVVGYSLNDTMTTLFVLLALLIAGGEGIRGFAAALTFGVVIGTYSSIYIAANMLLVMNISREDLVVPEKESAKESYP